MAHKAALLGTGHPAAQANALCGAGSTGLTATGTSNADALVVSSHLNAFSTVASSTGAILSTVFTPGDEIYIYNGGANTLTIYPPVTSPLSTIDNGSSATIVTLKGIRLVLGATGAWLSHKST